MAGPRGSNFGFGSEFGSFPDPTRANGSEISVNGGQGGDNAWYLDGNLNLSGFAENVAVNPAPDAVQEFQAITSPFAAEYGRTDAGYTPLPDDLRAESVDLLVQTGANHRCLMLGHVDTMLHGTRTRGQVRDVLISIAREGGYRIFP